MFKLKGKDEPVTIFEVCNSDPEPIREQKLGSREKFAEALTNYRAQKWTAAMTKFKSCLKDCPEDGAAELYLERCKYLRKHLLQRTGRESRCLLRSKSTV